MDFRRRIALLKKCIKARGLDSFLVTGKTNVSYLSGFSCSSSMILVTPDKTFFLTDSRYVQEARESIRGFTIELIRDSAYSALRGLSKTSRIRRMGFEAMGLQFGAFAKLKALLPGVKLTPTEEIIEEFRAVKDADEIRRIKESIRLTRAVLGKAVRYLRPGITEESIARNIEVGFLNSGARTAFDPIVASGSNSSKPHATPGRSRVRNNSFVMIDLGCKLGGYCSDMTRTVLLGAMKDRFADIYKVVRVAQDKAIEKIKAGSGISEVDFAARGYIHSRGFGKYFGHSAGHGVGMDIHEQPTVSRATAGFLRKGMVITVEPAIYLPGFGGVRIEDMVLVTDDGCEILTK